MEPHDWENIWEALYYLIRDWDPYPNIRQDLCKHSGFFTHECVCDKPSWKSSEFFKHVSPVETFSYFLDMLQHFDQHTFCTLDPYLREAVKSFTAYDYYAAFMDFTSCPLAVRWAAYKAYTLALPRGTPQFAYMHALVERLELDVHVMYFAVAYPEGPVEDVCRFSYDLLTTMSDFCGGVMHDCSTYFRDILLGLMKRAFAAPHELYVNFKKWLAEAMVEGFALKAADLVQSFKSFILHPLTTLLFKTMVRWWMGLSLKSITLEILWDPELVSHIPQLLTILADASKSAGAKVADGLNAARAAASLLPSVASVGVAATATAYSQRMAPHLGAAMDRFSIDPNLDWMCLPEAVDEAGIIVLLTSLAMGVLSTLAPTVGKVDFAHFSHLTRDIYTSSSLLDKLGAKDAISNLIRYMKGVQLDQEEAARFGVLYPKTMAFIQAHVTYVSRDPQNNADKSHFKHTYKEFLGERLRWSQKDSQRLAHLSSLAVNCATQLGCTAHYQFRREPSTFVFMGPPGLGKTSVCEAALNAIANKEDPNRNLADAIYTVCMTDSYCSGYVNQELWKFDDMFKKVDAVGSPSPDIELMFSLCTTAPFVLNMAAVEDKGKVARCYLAAGSTNLSFFDFNTGAPRSDITAIMKVHIESYKDAGAIRRRLTHCVLPIVQKPYAYNKATRRIELDGRPIKDSAVDRSLLYRFHLIDNSDRLVPSPHDPEDSLWTWSELLNLMWREYALTRDYTPEDDDSLAADVSLIQDDVGSGIGSAEGLVGDILGNIAVGASATIGGLAISMAAYQIHKYNEGEPCPCGYKTFSANNDACIAFEIAYREQRNIEPIPGHWYKQQCFDIVGNSHKSSFKWNAWTGDVRFVFDPVANLPQDGQHVVVGNWKDLMTVVRDFARPERRGFNTVLVTRDLESRSCAIPQGPYVITSWCVAPSSIDLHHRGAYSPTEWLYLCYTDWVMLPVVGCLIGGGIASFLRWKFTAVEEGDHAILKDGEALFLNPDTMEYTAQAPPTSRARVFKNGKWYYKVKKSNGGYEWYAQSPDDNPFVNLITKSQRLQCQTPSLHQSLWAVVDSEGKLQANVFAIDSRRVICPLHVAHVLSTKLGLSLVRDTEVRKVSPNFGSGEFAETNVLITKIGPDAAIVEFFVTKLPEVFTKCRDHVSKFSEAPPKSGSTTLIRRNARGQIETSTGMFTVPTTLGLSYSHGSRIYDVPAKDTRVVDTISEPGWCGALYVDNSEFAEHTCLGIHIARGSASQDMAVMHVVTSTMLRPQPISIPVGNVWLTGHGEAGHLFEQAGIPVVGKSAHPPLRSVYGRDTKKAKTVFHEQLSCQYDMAKLTVGSYPDGSRFSPWAVSLKKLGDRVNEPDHGAPGLVEVVHALAADYRPHFPLKALPTWQDTVSFETGLPSVSKKTSAGDPYYAWGGLKGTAFMKGCELNILTPEYLEFLEWADDRLAPPDWKTRQYHEFMPLESVCNGDNKDEPRSAAKVYKPRLYMVENMHGFLLQRRYFSDVAVAYGQFNTVFCSALGLAPTDFDVIHSSLLEAGQDALVLALDHEHMDGHVKPRFVRLVGLFLILLTGSTDPNGRKVDPILPPLDRRGFMMWRILQRIAWFVVKVGDVLAEPGASHPSGSFLTAIINGVVQDLLTVWVFQQLLKLELPVVIRDIKRIFLGDDSLIAIPAKYAQHVDVLEVKRLFGEQGFVVTGSEIAATKSSEIVLHPLWNSESGRVSDYAFLSRYFAVVESNEGPSIVGLLEQAKIEKIICFTDKKKSLDNFPEQVLSMLLEIELYSRCSYPDALAFVKKMHRVLDYISPGFLSRALYVLKTQGDVAVIRHEVLKFISSNTLLCTAQAGEGSEMAGLSTIVSDVVSDNLDSRDGDIEDWRLSGMENASHNDPDIFNTYFSCHEFDWDNVSDTLLMQKKIPEMFFDGNPMAQMKLANYAFLRATACVKVVINSTPYVAGKLFLSCRPLGRQVADLYEACGDPGIEIDAASGKEVELEMPIIVPHNWSLIETYGQAVVSGRDYFNWGYFNITVLSPINTADAQQVHGKVFCRLKNVQLQGPTPTNFAISAQAPPAKSTLKKPPQKPRPIQRFNGRVDPFTVKMAGSRPTESSSLSAGIDKYVAPVVKSIGGVVADIGATALTVAKIAALAGLSAPMQDNNTMAMNAVFPNLDTAHMGGVIMGPHLASYQSQKVVLPENTFDLAADEMNIAHFTSRMALCFKVDWDASALSDEIITSFRVMPSLVYKDGLALHHTPLSFIAQMFRFWRGSIKYRIAIAKTRFHSGSLEISYSSGIAALPISSEQRAAKCYRHIWNVNEMSSFEFEVPYSAATIWTPILYKEYTGEEIVPDPSITAGVITIRVINPLVSAGSAATDHVELLVYTAGGSDIEFSVPTLPSLGTVGISYPVASPEVGGGVYQDDETEGLESGGTVPLFPASPLSDIGTVACVGERVDNLRLLTRRFPSNTFERVPVNYTGGKFIQVSTADMFLASSFLERLSNAFAFASGGFRAELSCTSELASTFPQENLSLMNGAGLASAPMLYRDNRDNNSFVVSCPYYGVTPYLPVAQYKHGTTGSLSQTLYGTMMSLAIRSAHTTKCRVTGADDFTFGWQIGVPAAVPTSLLMPTPSFVTYE